MIVVSAGILTLGALVGVAPRGPAVRYALAIDAAHLDVADVTIEVPDVPADFEIAMKVHAEYDARYWRYLDAMRVETRDGRAGTVVGLRTGDGLVAIDSSPVASFADLRTASRRARLGPDTTATVAVDVVRDGVRRRVVVRVGSYRTPHVHLVDVSGMTPDQQSRRAEWLTGN